MNLRLRTGNSAQLQGVLEFSLQTSHDLLEPATARLAVDFLQQCITAWGPPSGIPAANGDGVPHPAPATMAGFEAFLYERLVPLPFEVASLPACNPLDGQTMVVRLLSLRPPGIHTDVWLQLLNSLADLLKTAHKIRGQEALDFLAGVYLPSQNCPAETAMAFATSLRDLDQKAFRKYYVEFVKALRRAP